MKLLAFDTSTSVCAVAIYHDHHIINEQILTPNQHGKNLLFLINSILNKANLSLAELDAIAFGCGPGSFTGIRLASATAQALAYVHIKPIIRISSLQLLAQTAHQLYGWNRVIVLLDAKVKQVFLGIFQLQNAIMMPQLADIKVPLAQCGTLLVDFCQTGQQYFGIGDGWSSISPPAELQDIKTTTYLSGEALANLAKSQYQLGHLLNFFEAQPNYL